MTTYKKKHRVGELRPSQLLFSYGVGATVDLPNISAMVMGLDDWTPQTEKKIIEARLLEAVRRVLGPQVQNLYSPPAQAEQQSQMFEDHNPIGVPVTPFPRWMLCPRCRSMGTLESGLFELRGDRFRPDRVRYVHANCARAVGKQLPVALPARFMVACEAGHLDDFPWVYFVHKGETQCAARLVWQDRGVSGEAVDIHIVCETCGASRTMADAIGQEGWSKLPPCTGRYPHLRSTDEQPCERQPRTMALGASNSWFPLVLSALAVPMAIDPLTNLIEEYWPILHKATSEAYIHIIRDIDQLPRINATYSDEEIWESIEAKKGKDAGAEENPQLHQPLKVPEWQIITQRQASTSNHDFTATPIAPPAGYERFLKQVILVERLRVVQSLIGFTRIASSDNATDGYSDVNEVLGDNRVALSRRAPIWTPAAEVRGEGIFLEFQEQAIQEWLERDAVRKHNKYFHGVHTRWRSARKIPNPELGYPGLRYMLLHSFSHALIRQLALECGYSTASVRERIYSLSADDQSGYGPMAGILLYTSAPDSEGTLGGLVGLGKTETLGCHLDAALEQMQNCASDPLCAEHTNQQNATLHEAACHACLFIPETSCERGNKYLDRSVLIPTIDRHKLAFFSSESL